VSRYVLDNTVTMAWCFDDETTAFTEMLLNRLSTLTDTALVPALWLYEVANVTELGVRKGRITEDKAHDFLDSLGDLPIEVENPSRLRMFDAVRALAKQFKLTAYDASYLELAIRHQLPLAALDNPLGRAAKAAGVVLLSP
jgi:predicted nucleic acid-binding protein